MSSENQDTREYLEGEAYQEKQYEDYLRLNPVEDLDTDVILDEVVADVELEKKTRCRCDDSEPMEYITCCHCGFKECEIYSFRYKSSLYCNNCAYDVCGILIDKPKYAFNIDDKLYKFNKTNNTNFKSEVYDRFIKLQEKYQLTVDDALYYGQECHCCGNQPEDTCSEFCSDVCEKSYNDTHECFYKNDTSMCKMCVYNDRRASYEERNGGYGGNDGGYYPKEGEEGVVDYTVTCERCVSEILYNDSVKYNEQLFCEECAYDYREELLGVYSEEQRQEIYRYAEKHNLTTEEAIDYQTHCHCCGNEDTTPVFDGDNHQYCNKRCFNHCEDYWYECYRGEECKVCEISQYHKTRDSLTAYDIHLSECEPVLAAIDAFKELKVHGQFYECLGDLTEYFGDLAFYDDNVHPDLYY